MGSLPPAISHRKPDLKAADAAPRLLPGVDEVRDSSPHPTAERVLSISPQMLEVRSPRAVNRDKTVVNGLKDPGRDLVEQLRACEQMARETSELLHERLRLGARMLKALQSQIDRTAVHTSGRRDEFELAVAAAVQAQLHQWEERLENSVLEGLARIDHAMGARERRLGAALKQLEATLATAARALGDSERQPDHPSG